MKNHAVTYRELVSRRRNLRDTIMTLSEELNSVELAIREREADHRRDAYLVRLREVAEYFESEAAPTSWGLQILESVQALLADAE